MAHMQSVVDFKFYVLLIVPSTTTFSIPYTDFAISVLHYCPSFILSPHCFQSGTSTTQITSLIKVFWWLTVVLRISPNYWFWYARHLPASLPLFPTILSHQILCCSHTETLEVPQMHNMLPHLCDFLWTLCSLCLEIPFPFITSLSKKLFTIQNLVFLILLCAHFALLWHLSNWTVAITLLAKKLFATRLWATLRTEKMSYSFCPCCKIKATYIVGALLIPFYWLSEEMN